MGDNQFVAFSMRPQLKKSFTIERKIKEQFDSIRETEEVVGWIEQVLGSYNILIIVR